MKTTILLISHFTHNILIFHSGASSFTSFIRQKCLSHPIYCCCWVHVCANILSNLTWSNWTIHSKSFQLIAKKRTRKNRNWLSNEWMNDNNNKLWIYPCQSSLIDNNFDSSQMIHSSRFLKFQRDFTILSRRKNCVWVWATAWVKQKNALLCYRYRQQNSYGVIHIIPV